MVMLAARAPRAMPGQIRIPNTSSAATAIPVGGHSGVTWPRTNCWSSPRRAVA